MEVGAIKKRISRLKVTSFPLREIHTPSVGLNEEVSRLCLFNKLGSVCIIIVKQGIEAWLA